MLHLPVRTHHPATRFFLAGIFFFAGSFVSAADQKMPTPDAQSQAKALRNVREVYQADFAKHGVEDQRALARKLMDAANDSKGDAAARFVLLKESMDISAAIGDAGAAVEASKALAASFDVNSLELRYKLITTMRPAAKSPATLAELTSAAIDLSTDAFAAGDAKMATSAASTAESMATSIHDAPLVAQARAQRARIREAQQAFDAEVAARAKLAADPSDAPSNKVMGRILCFVKNDWEHGLPCLAKSGDPVLQAMAAKELAKPTDPAAQAALGDAWWNLPAGTGIAQMHARQRAAFWYQLAAPGLTGLNKGLVEKRIADAGASASTSAAGGQSSSSPSDEKSFRSAGGVFLCDMKEKEFKAGSNQSLFKGAKAYEGLPVKINGTSYAHGLGICGETKADAYATYTLDGQYRRFHAGVGILYHPANKINGEPHIIFRLVGDGKTLWQSQELVRRDDRTDSCWVNITGVKELTLVVNCPGTNAGAWAEWLDPQVLR